jgi:hypothetical protein
MRQRLKSRLKNPDWQAVSYIHLLFDGAPTDQPLNQICAMTPADETMEMAQ